MLISALLFLGACDADEPDCCFNMDVGVDMMVSSEDGTDLLNPDNPGAFLEKDISLYYLVDGESERYFRSHLDASRGFTIYRNESLDAYVISIFPNTAESEAYPITYIEWSETDTDTLRCEFERTKNSLLGTQVWFNGQLKRGPSIAERVFEVIK